MRTKSMFILLCATLVLAACGHEPDDAATGQPVDVAAAADAPAGVSLSGAEVRMPAVPDRPGVAYFTIASEEPRTIVGVSVLGTGRSEMHETNNDDGRMSMAAVEQVPLQPGEPLSFQPGGYHVMLFDMDATLAPGGSADLTITFEGGDKASIAAKVVGPGGMAHDDMAHDDMAGMDH